MKTPLRLILLALALVAVVAGVVLLVAWRKQHQADGPTLTLDLGRGVKLELVRIEPGEFAMGSEEAEEPYRWGENQACGHQPNGDGTEHLRRMRGFASRSEEDNQARHGHNGNEDDGCLLKPAKVVATNGSYHGLLKMAALRARNGILFSGSDLVQFPLSPLAGRLLTLRRHISSQAICAPGHLIVITATALLAQDMLGDLLNQR